MLVVLVESPGQSSAIRGVGHPGRPRRAAPAAMAPLGAAGLAPHSATPASRTGLRLLSQAAVACETVPFHGVQISTWFGSAAETASVIQVWHRSDGQILVQASPTGTSPAEPGQARPGVPAGQDQVLSVTSPLLNLMRRNYTITYDGHSAVDGRAALLVTVRGPGGRPAARYWIDAATKLPLRREVLVDGSRILSEDAFLSLSVGASQLHGMPTAERPALDRAADRGRPGRPGRAGAGRCRGTPSAGCRCSSPPRRPVSPARS